MSSSILQPVWPLIKPHTEFTNQLAPLLHLVPASASHHLHQSSVTSTAPEPHTGALFSTARILGVVYFPFSRIQTGVIREGRLVL